MSNDMQHHTLEQLAHALGQNPQFQLLQANLAYQFRDLKLVVAALTHKSFSFESLQSLENLERLEFLGDSVLQTMTSFILFKELCECSEGDLSRIRANLVSQQVLNRIAQYLNIPHLIFLGKGLQLKRSSNTNKFYSDALEALVAVVFLEVGFVESCQIVKDLFLKALELKNWQELVEINSDYKTQLQEKIQAKYQSTPIYQAKAHEKGFKVSLWILQREICSFIDESKKRAEKKCAEYAFKNKLYKLGVGMKDLDSKKDAREENFR